MAKSYRRLPEIPQEMQERYRVMVEVLSGKLTVREGAASLGLSRNQFERLRDRTLEGLLGAMQGHAGGRPTVPETQRRAEAENQKIERESERLRRHLDTTERRLGLASVLLKGRIK